MLLAAQVRVNPNPNPDPNPNPNPDPDPNPNPDQVELKVGGYSAQECKEVGVSALEAGFGARDAYAEGFTVAECRLAGQG